MVDTRLMLGHETYQQVLDNLHDGLYFVDTERVITYWNRAAERITGYRAEEVVGRTCADSILTHIDERGQCLCDQHCPLAETIGDGCARESVLYMHHRDGHRIEVSMRTSVLRNDAGEVTGGIELFSDISSQKANLARIQELEQLAFLDGLTRLANRTYIERELESRMQEYRRFQIPFAVLFIDIDHFKRVNDQYGHSVGDDVLKFVASTFITNSRPFDLYGRWGGEEFIGVIPNCSRANLKVLAERLRVLVEHAYIIRAGTRIAVTISMGAAEVQPGESVSALLERADRLMYQSKREGRNRVSFD